MSTCDCAAFSDIDVAGPWYVVVPIMDGPDRWESSTIISRHYRLHAARRAMERATARVRRQSPSAWLDWHIVPAGWLSAQKRRAR